MHQSDLKWEPAKHVHTDDPDTSRAAVFSIEHATVVMQRVYGLIRGAGEAGLTDEELTERYRHAHGPSGDSSIRSRRSDLVTHGYVLDSGLTRPIRSGRKAIVWRLV